MKRYTYKDFRVGQKVTLYSLQQYSYDLGKRDGYFDFYQDYLKVGNTYEIDDLDWHFPDKICIKLGNGKSGFLPITLFISELSEERETKINQIIK